jgi:hypothetical protein
MMFSQTKVSSAGDLLGRTHAPATLLQMDEELMHELAHEHHELVQAQLVNAKPLPLHCLGKDLEVQQRSLQYL